MKNAISVTLEGVNFNAENVASKQKESFISEMMQGKSYGGFKEADRRKLFAKAYDLCRKAVNPKSEKENEE